MASPQSLPHMQGRQAPVAGQYREFHDADGTRGSSGPRLPWV